MNYGEIVKKQSDYFNSNQTKDICFRIEQLKKLKRLIKNQEPVLYEAIYADFKKSAFETFTTELSFIYNDIDLFVKKLPKWSRKKRAKTNLLNLPGQSFILPEPLGVCLIIGTWNYPYQLTLLPLVAAIASGNTVILKPSEIAPATSTAIRKLINENFPSEFVYVIEGGIPETTALLDQKFDKIFFTGSSKVGRIVYQAAAKNLTPVTLELSGKSPAIVTRNSNLKESAKRIVWAKFLNSGQSCIAPDYALVDEAVKDEFLTYLKEFIEKSQYSFENRNFVQIIDERNFNRLAGLIDKKKIYHGGETDLQRRYCAPTLLTGITFNDRIMDDEIFGPILPVISYSDLNDAIAEIKSRPKPLSCYIFTNDDQIRNKTLKEISFGGGAVNDAIMHFTNNNLPFGGVGNSGIGSYHGKAGFVAFSHFKSILDKPFWLEPNLKYSPYSERKLSLIKRLIG
jgi:aldehyde dehydrogenase (NAD+)